MYRQPVTALVDDALRTVDMLLKAGKPEEAMKELEWAAQFIFGPYGVPFRK